MFWPFNCKGPTEATNLKDREYDEGQSNPRPPGPKFYQNGGEHKTLRIVRTPKLTYKQVKVKWRATVWLLCGQMAGRLVTEAIT